jgi:predicted nucleic acid binding AN1-type Zn finger protein
MERDRGTAPGFMDGPSTKARCAHCAKKLPLTAAACRCDKLLCAAHRCPEDHGCTFDYRAAGRALLRANMPVIACPKLERV